MIGCPYCASPLLTPSPDGERLKARTTIVVLHKSGAIEINCSACKNGVLLPVAATQPVELRKGRQYRPIVLRRQ